MRANWLAMSRWPLLLPAVDGVGPEVLAYCFPPLSVPARRRSGAPGVAGVIGMAGVTDVPGVTGVAGVAGTGMVVSRSTLPSSTLPSAGARSCVRFSLMNGFFSREPPSVSIRNGAMRSPRLRRTSMTRS